MKKFLLSLALLCCSSLSFAQTTTLTTQQDTFVGRFLQGTIAVADQNNQSGSVTVDNRSTVRGPLGNLSFSTPDASGSAKGTFSGLPTGRAANNATTSGTITYSGNGFTTEGVPFTVTGTFPFTAVYKNVCGPRSPTCGWYITFKKGSNVDVF